MGIKFRCDVADNRTKLTLTPLRSRMLPDAVEAIEVCGALYKSGLFVDHEMIQVEDEDLAE